jgi:PadR family transcriptional regulator PadR
MKYSKEIIKGSTKMIILSSLKCKAQYAYEIIGDIERASKSKISFPASTVYSAMKVLESQKLVTQEWEESEGSHLSRKYYQITDEGNQWLEDRIAEWNDYHVNVVNLIEYYGKEGKSASL